MRTLSADTHPEVEQLHIELLRNAPVWKRLQMVNSMVKTTWRLSWHGICERYPDTPLKERIEQFLILLYNDKIMAQRVASLYCAKKKQGNEPSL